MINLKLFSGNAFYNHYGEKCCHNFYQSHKSDLSFIIYKESYCSIQLDSLCWASALDSLGCHFYVFYLCACIDMATSQVNQKNLGKNILIFLSIFRFPTPDPSYHEFTFGKCYTYVFSALTLRSWDIMPETIKARIGVFR